MRVVKKAALGLTIIGFALGTAGVASACSYHKTAHNTKKPTVKQTVVTNTTKSKKQ